MRLRKDGERGEHSPKRRTGPSTRMRRLPMLRPATGVQSVPVSIPGVQKHLVPAERMIRRFVGSDVKLARRFFGSKSQKGPLFVSFLTGARHESPYFQDGLGLFEGENRFHKKDEKAFVAIRGVHGRVIQRRQSSGG
jgi:hypothetical protein